MRVGGVNNMKNNKIAVAGTGYVGLSIATLLSQHHQVTAVDIVPEKVELINNRKSEFVDEFDNKVCYWVMTATSFCDILSGKKVGLGEDKQDDSFPFIFQEANFYVNKSIDKLDVMKPCAEVIFNKGVAYSKLIDAYRLETVIYILKEVRKKSYSSEKELEENGNLSQEGIQMVAKQKECDKEYNQKMQTILGSEEIKNVLEKELKWID